MMFSVNTLTTNQPTNTAYDTDARAHLKEVSYLGRRVYRRRERLGISSVILTNISAKTDQPETRKAFQN